MAYKKVLVGDYFQFRRGLGYKDEYIVEESEVALIGMDSHLEGGGFKDGSEKPYSGSYKVADVANPGEVIFAEKDLTQEGKFLASPLMIPKNGKFKVYIYSCNNLKAIKRKEGFLEEFLYNIFRCEKYRLKAAYGNTGTTVRVLPPEALEEQLVPLPDVNTQESINEVISLIDQQIENNKSLAKNLEALAQSIFRSWFVDFEPVQAKSRGEKPFGMDDETAALFPESFEKSELGLIPTSWEICTIESLADVVVGGTPSRAKSEYWNGNIPWVNSGKINEFRVVNPSEYISELGLKKSAAKLMPVGTTLLAMTGATLGQFTRMEIEAAGTQNVIGICGSDKLSNEFIYLTVKNNISRVVASATGGAQQHINKRVVQDLTIAFPGESLVRIFTEVIEPVFQLIGNITFQILELQKLLETLIPELISENIYSEDLALSL